MEPNNIDKTRFKGSIPKEINTHLDNFKVEMWEAKDDEFCDLCGSHIDEMGYCRCGTGSIG